MSIKEDENGKELKQPDYDEDKEFARRKARRGNRTTRNN